MCGHMSFDNIINFSIFFFKGDWSQGGQTKELSFFFLIKTLKDCELLHQWEVCERNSFYSEKSIICCFIDIIIQMDHSINSGVADI